MYSLTVLNFNILGSFGRNVLVAPQSLRLLLPTYFKNYILNFFCETGFWKAGGNLFELILGGPRFQVDLSSSSSDGFSWFYSLEFACYLGFALSLTANVVEMPPISSFLMWLKE
jgi:hypothetical protein